MLQNTPSFFDIQSFHELRSAGWVQRSTELAEFVSAILREHFAQFRKEKSCHRVNFIKQ
jgi:hypothetical protein